MSDYDFQRRSMDDAIDDAVRDMIRRDPRPGLRRRVLAKIDAPARQSALTNWLIAPAGVLACALLAVFLFSRATRETPATTDGPPAIAERAPVRNPQPESDTAKTGREERVSEGGIHTRTGRSRATTTPASIFGARTGRVSAASLRSAVEIDVLSPSDTVMPLPAFMVESAPSALVLPALEIQPLQLPALASRR